MIFHSSEVETYESPGDGKRTIQYLVEPERAGLQRLVAGLMTIESGGWSDVAAHEAEEVYFVLEGHAQIRLGNEERVVGPGSVIAISSNVRHQVGAIDDRVRIYFTLSPPPTTLAAKKTWKRIP